MAKTRIFKLAQDLNVGNKELIDRINKEFGLGITNHQSSIDDSQAAKISGFYSKAKDVPKPAAISGNRAEIEKPHTDRPLRPEGERRPRPEGERRPRPEGERRPRPDGERPIRPEGERRPRPEGERRPRPDGERPARPEGERRPRPEGERPSRPQTDRVTSDSGRSVAPSRDERPPRPQGDRPPYNRPQGDRPPYNKPQGDRPPYNRPQGDRPPYNRPQGDRPPYNRPQGDRPPYNRPQGDRPGGGMYNKDGPNKDRQGGGRPPQSRTPRPGGDKNKLTQQEKPQKQGYRNNQDKQHGRRDFKSEKPEGGNRRGLKQTQKPVKLTPRPVIETPKNITIPAVVSLKVLAEAMRKPGAELVKLMMARGEMVNVNQEIDFETAASIALEFDVLAEEKVEVDVFEEAFAQNPDSDDDMITRPPIVVVMGHVDHGKTSLLDAIRQTNVVSVEAGGITQHIGAYTVSINNQPITFLDTPGHEAFTAMRMRGAQITDIAVLVVAADDGVMPQTIEAINHAKAANVDIIVAINKIDKPSANPDRVKQELLEYGLVAEDYGGETICVPVSAHNRSGIDHLLEMIILVSEIKDMKANPNKKARGTIIESSLDKGKGAVATVLVQEGTLAVGDPIVSGVIYGKIRAMTDDKGKRVKKAGPGIPVEILGMPDVPQAGDMFYAAENEKQARQVAESYFAKGRVDMLKAAAPQKISLDDLFTQIKSGSIKELKIVIKADVQGSVEAVRTSLEKLSNDEVKVRVIHGGVGAINETDINLASASTAIVIGFNVRPEPSAKSVAIEQQVDVRLYRIIYNAIEDIEAAMKGMLDPVYEEKVLGHVEIRQIFKASGIGTIGGSYVLDGKIIRNSKARVVRDGIVVYDGEIDTLRRFKDDVKEVATGYECGIVLSKFNDIKEHDIVEAYVMEQIER